MTTAADRSGAQQSRTYRRADCVVFRKTNETFGGLSNMAGGFPLVVNGIAIRTSEALYQACRFPHRPDLQREIIDQHSPMAAKMKSKPFHPDSRPDWSQVRVKIMRWCLRVKLAQNWDSFGGLLLSTSDRPIVEESARDTYWGARPIDDGTLVGRNVLGRLLMELRKQWMDGDKSLEVVEPPSLDNFILYGKPVTTVDRPISPPNPTAAPEDPINPELPMFAQHSTSVHNESDPQPGNDQTGKDMTSAKNYRKKLIEVALPLEAINEASAREKSIRHGHPSTLHLWWARRPLAAARAVIFTSLVDDPDDPDAPPAFVAACRALPLGKNAGDHDSPRMRLFDFIERLVQWESTTDEPTLETARELIRLCTGGNPPPLLDPFAGGGSIPLEAQRLGLEAHAGDLNPVAVMINKALIEIPPRFAGQAPVNPRDRERVGGGAEWPGATGLAADVRYYGEWMRDRARERIGHLYPDLNGETVIAWLWARTVKCPNPACGAQMPLVRSFDLSTKKGKRAWVEPKVNPHTREIAFEVKQRATGKGPEGTVDRQGATCLACDTPVKFDYIRDEGKAGRMSAQLMAIVTEGKSGRNYHAPDKLHERTAEIPIPEGAPDTDLPEQALGFRVQLYGMTKHRDLFTPRQLVALTTFSDLVAEARAEVERDGLAAGLPADETPLRDGGRGARAYAEAVSVYLAFGVSRLSDRQSTIASWDGTRDSIRNTFARQAIPMVWDFAEGNIFSDSTGNWLQGIEWISRVIEQLKPISKGYVGQADATSLDELEAIPISTDPPYYDNIGYADLSDYFYSWLRPALRSVYPKILGTLLVPKEPELVATPYRFGGNADSANKHFELGLLATFRNIRRIIPPEFPLTIYYAFKQQEIVADVGTASTGWETMLTGLIVSGFSIVGTWPMRTELSTRMVGRGTNALASSIVLVCRPRPDDAPSASRRAFLAELRATLPAALREMQSGNIAPVDLAQASIGPGMAVYSKYRQVLEANGEALTVRAALQLINQVLDEFLAEQEGDLDGDSRFAVAWFETNGFKEGAFGTADVLARAKNTSVDGLVDAGIVRAGAGKVQLLTWQEMDPGWDPQADKRPTVWEATHHLIERLNVHGEEGAALLLARMPADLATNARDLAYRLYNICERKGWTEFAREYNALVVSWGASRERAAQVRTHATQGRLFEE